MGNNISSPFELCSEIIKSNNKIINLNDKIISQNFNLDDSNRNDVICDIVLTNVRISDSNDKIIDKILKMIPKDSCRDKSHKIKRSQSF